MGNKQLQLYEDAKVILDKIITKQLLKPKAVFGLFEANTVNDDDISIQKKGEEIAVFRTLRQQLKREKENQVLLCQILLHQKNQTKKIIWGLFVLQFLEQTN